MTIRKAHRRMWLRLTRCFLFGHFWQTRYEESGDIHVRFGACRDCGKPTAVIIIRDEWVY
jgi:hypothetical protein